MQQIPWHRLLSVVAIVAPVAGDAQPSGLRVRVIASIPGVAVDEAVRMPNGRVILYNDGHNIMAYDLAAKRATFLANCFDQDLTVSPAGDRVAYARHCHDVNGDTIWLVPVDPNTGHSTGPAQRVSMRSETGLSFSPDGKYIAYGAEQSNQASDLVVVPASGGAERVLAHYDTWIGGASWSVDGKWVFADVPGDTTRSLQRVAAAGGSSERVLSYSGGYAGSLNGRITFYRPDTRAESEGRVAYVTGSGTHGRFQVPPGSRLHLRGSIQPLLTRVTPGPSTTQILNLVDGAARHLAPGVRLPATWYVASPAFWSPDSRRLALIDSTGGHTEIMVMNADGSQPRRYPVSLHLTNATLRWSPKDQLLAYYAGGGDSSLSVLDLATGRSHRLFSAADAEFNVFVWRPDGQSIVLMKQSVRAGAPHRELFEARLDGTVRKLRDIGGDYFRVYIISDQLLIGAIVGSDSSGAKRNSYPVIPADSGPPRELSGAIGRRCGPSSSADGRWLLFLIRTISDARLTDIELITTGGDSSRMVKLPFELDGCGLASPMFHPDGRHVVLVGKLPGDSTSKMFLVSFDGTAPRVLAILPAAISSIGLSFSPDGNTLAYTVEGAPSTVIYELDVSPILKAARMPRLR